MPRRAYEGTAVPISKSQDEIRRILVRYGADSFSFGQGRDWAGVEFVHNEVLIRMRAPVKLATIDDARELMRTGGKSLDHNMARAVEMEHQRIWRVLHWSIKARMEAVEEGVETFEQAFLAHVVDPATNRTVWDVMAKPIESGMFALGGRGLKALGSGTD